MEYRFTAIVLGKRDIGETDRLYILYTKEKGKVTSFARGIRKPGARLSSQLENFSLSSVVIMRKRGKGNIKSAIAENSFLSIRQSCEALERSFFVAKTLDRVIKEEEPDEKLFYLLSDFFYALNLCVEKEKEDRIVLVQYAFLFQFLDRLGYAISLGKTCVSCDIALSSDALFFSFDAGGMLCQNCAQSEQDVILVSKQLVKFFRLFRSHTFISFLKIIPQKRDMQELERVLLYCIERILR